MTVIGLTAVLMLFTVHDQYTVLTRHAFWKINIQST